MFREEEDNNGFLVSAKLQRVALRTPPPTDSYLIQCFGSPSSGSSSRPLRLPGDATFLDLLLRLGLITSDEHRHGAASVARSLGGVRRQRFDIRPALGDGSPNTAFPPVDLVDRSLSRILDCPGLRFPFAVHVTPVDCRAEEGTILEQAAGESALLELQNVSPDGRAAAVPPLQSIAMQGTAGAAADLELFPGGAHSATLAGSASNLAGRDEHSLRTNSPDPTRSRSEQRKERRAQYEAERARLKQLEERRESNLRQITERQQAEDSVAKNKAAREEARRQSVVLEHRRAIGERLAKVENRAVVADEAKRALELKRVTCILTAKVELEQSLELARQRLSYAKHAGESNLHDVKSPARGQEEAPPTAVSSVTASSSPYNLPLSDETEDIILEKKQAAESFVNRVVAAKKLNERRLSRFSTNPEHPLEQSRSLQDVLSSLSCTIVANKALVENESRNMRLQKVEEKKEAYHTQLMREATEARVQIKMQRHREKLAAQVRESRLAEEEHARQLDDQRLRQRDEQQRADEFRQRKRQIEETARKRAQEEKEYERYMIRQRVTLHDN